MTSNSSISVTGGNLQSENRPPVKTTSGATEPIFPESQLVIRSWPDSVLDELGHDPRSGYAERFWVSVIGPSCYLALRRFSDQLDRQPDGFEVDTADLALELGLGAKGGRHGPMWRAIERACHFRLAHRQGPMLAVRRRFPPLSRRQLKRMPDHLVAAHEQWQSERLTMTKRKTIALPHEALRSGQAHVDPGDRAA